MDQALEQKEDLVKIAEESLKVLEEITEHGWAAYPVSLWPVPQNLNTNLVYN